MEIYPQSSATARDETAADAEEGVAPLDRSFRIVRGRFDERTKLVEDGALRGGLPGEELFDGLAEVGPARRRLLRRQSVSTCRKRSPPSTAMFAPVMKLAASLARNRTGPTTSAGVARRWPSGTRRATFS